MPYGMDHRPQGGGGGPRPLRALSELAWADLAETRRCVPRRAGAGSLWTGARTMAVYDGYTSCRARECAMSR